MRQVVDLRIKSLEILEQIAFWKLEYCYEELMQELKRGFNPSQPRVPAGNPDGGQWADGGSSGGVSSDNSNGNEFNNEATEFIGDVVSLLPIGRIPKIIKFVRAMRMARRAKKLTKDIGVTEHAAKRFAERGISRNDVRNAIRTAEKNGRVTNKIGKYGTEQKIYKGDNGITVVVETSGRNAGKVISAWNNE